VDGQYIIVTDQDGNKQMTTVQTPVPVTHLETVAATATGNQTVHGVLRNYELPTTFVELSEGYKYGDKIVSYTKDGVTYTVENLMSADKREAPDGYIQARAADDTLMGYQLITDAAVSTGTDGSPVYTFDHDKPYITLADLQLSRAEFVGYTANTTPLLIGRPVTADISEYLQVAYNDTSLWSVGPFAMMTKGGMSDAATGLLYGPTLGQGGNQDRKGNPLDFSEGVDELGYPLPNGQVDSDGNPMTDSLWGLPGQVSAGSADIAGAPISGVIAVQNSVKADDQHSIVMKNNGSLWAYGKNGSGRIGDGTATSTAIPVRVGASYFILEDYNVSIREGESFQFDVEPKISAFNVFNNIEEDASKQELAWFTWDAQEDSDWTTLLEGEHYKTSENEYVKVEYETKNVGLPNEQNDKRATITGKKAGTTYVLISVANDSLIVGSFKVEVRPGDEVYNIGSDRVDVIGQPNSNLAELNATLGDAYVPGTVQSGGLYQDMYDSYNDKAAVGVKQYNTTNLQTDHGNSVAYPMVAAGSDFTVALAGDGTVWTWGSNEYGQLGIGESYGSHAAPQQVIAQVYDEQGELIRYEYLNNVRKIAAAGNFVYALKNDGTVWSWGRNDAGQLGLGKDHSKSGWRNQKGEDFSYFTRVPFATQVGKGEQDKSTYESRYLQEIVDIAVGGEDDAHGFAYMVQSVYYKRQAIEVEIAQDGTRTERLIAKANALSGNIFGVGDNSANQVSLFNTVRNYTAPISVRVSSGIVAGVSIGPSATGHVLVGNGSVMGIGSNAYGAIGNASTSGTRGNAILPYRALSVSGTRNGALATVFQLKQAGDGQYVEVANRKKNQDQAAQNENDVTGTLYAWGQRNNTHSASEMANVTTPVRVTNTDRPNAESYRGGVMLTGGGSGMFTVDKNGAMIMRGGENSYGELGNGSTGASGGSVERYVNREDGKRLDASVADTDRVLSASTSAGGYHTAYSDNSGNVYSFGLNNMTQLGSQSLSNQYQITAFETNSKLIVEGKKDAINLMLESDESRVVPDSILYGHSFDLSANYTASVNFNLLKHDSNYISVRDLEDPKVYGGTSVKYTSLNPAVASVDNATGVVTAVSYGETDILVDVAVSLSEDETIIRTLQFHVSVVKPYEKGTYTFGETGGVTYTSDGATAVAYAAVAVGEDYTLALKADGTV
ncbi:MAG: Ig-like domain-containing protein, partial [Muribaculaceae bacterium]|nr:Ig-like domain-containing protein [Muribaculaceae bacterium]